jgi:hypothetical protein
MRVSAPVYSNGLLPHTTSSSNKHQSVQNRSSFLHQNTQFSNWGWLWMDCKH